MLPTTTTMPSKDPISSSSVTDRSGLSAARGSAVVLLSPSLFRISSPVHACAAVTSDAAVGPVGPLGRSWESSYMRMPHAQSMTDHVRMSPRTAVTASGTR